MGDDQLRFRVAVDERSELARDRRETAAAVDQDRHPPLGRELEHRRQALVVQEEPLRARVQLDPSRAAIEAAHCFLDRMLREVEPDERDQTAAGLLRVGERPVVRRAERRVPVRLIEAEHEAARDSVAVIDGHQVVVGAAEAVDVLSEMDVRVEDLPVFGQHGDELLRVLVDQCLGPRERLVHEA